MTSNSLLETTLAQIHTRFETAFEPLQLDGEPLWVLGITNMRSHLDALLAKNAISDPLRDLPLWAKVWPASFVLGRFLRKFEPEGKSLLEIGAGCGITSCLAARYGFERVVLSDIVNDALLFAQANILRNELEQQVSVKHVDVCTTRLQERFDIIAASEILYLDDIHRPLLRFFQRHLATGGKAVLCTDVARHKKRFLKLAEKEFSVTTQHVGVRSTDEDGTQQKRLYAIHILEHA